MFEKKELERLIDRQEAEIYQLKKRIERMEKMNIESFKTVLELEHKIRNYEQITQFSSLLGIL